MIFPTMKGKSVGYVNLNLLAAQWFAQHSSSHEQDNPFLDSANQAALLDAYHSRVGIDYSYGGWLEDRSTVWAGTYLDETRSFTHLGVDLNAPKDTPIATDHPGYVIRIDDDHPEEGGWGSRILFRLRDIPIVLIYAHLDPGILIKVGDVLGPGDILARVGPTSHNGGWFPHVHVQCLTIEAWELFTSDPGSLDGYGNGSSIQKLARLFPDPIRFIHFE
jgi:murein DD-endopeptidase MepM/ murein hydrolase activator NlpD